VCIPDLVIIKYFGNNTIEIKRIVFTYPDLLPSALVVKLELIHVYRTVGVHLLWKSCDVRPVSMARWNRGFWLAIDTGLTSQLIHNKWTPTVRYTWISSNLTTTADGSRSGYVKTILLISIVLFPKYFIITKSGVHTTVLTDFVYCIFR